MTSPLSELATALRTDASLLPWCVEHAPDGDADGAIARAWSPPASELWDAVAVLNARLEIARFVYQRGEPIQNAALTRLLATLDGRESAPPTFAELVKGT